MGKRLFEIEMSVRAVIELDDKVIEVVDDEWREQLYNLRTPKEIADHIAYNMIVNNARLSQLDGWADQPDENIRFVELPDWYTEECEEVTL